MKTLEETRRELFSQFEKALDTIDSKGGFPSMPYPYLNQLLQDYKKGTSRRQVIISFTKWMHGFNLSNISLDMAMMLREVSEMLEAYATEDVKATAFEIADVAIYCYGIAQMMGVNLDSVIGEKMSYNLQRNYIHKDVS